MDSASKRNLMLRRISAIIVDTLLFAGIAQAIIQFVIGPHLVTPGVESYYSIIFTLLFMPLVYFVGLTLWLGATPGKKFFQIRIINKDPNRKLSFFQLCLRELIGRWISALPLGVGYLVAFFSKEQVAWHDYIARTRVVMAEK